MKLYHLKQVSWLESQLIYHAQPRVGVEGINILAPREPYVCIGYHQDLGQEVDVDFCRAHNIPIFRREVGGGAVYLDGNQIFYQIVLHKTHPLARGNKTALYQRMLQPVAAAYTDLGVPAHYREVNDIITADGRKISGTGAAEIDDYIVLVGNLIADFDYQTMSRVLRVPDEKYRDKLFQSMRENLTTLKRELGRVLTWNEMVAPLVHRFAKLFGELEPAELPQTVDDEIAELKPRFLSEEWLYKKGKRQRDRAVKIATGVNIVRRVHKAPGGLLRATLEIKENCLHSVSLTGDFFCYPRGAITELEARLEGTAIEQLETIIAQFYADHEIETPGVAVADWLKVLRE